MPDLRKVAQVNDIPLGAGRSFEVDDKFIAVFNIDNQFYAIDDMCPHMGASLAAGHVENCVVSCPLHAWRFDVRDGTWCDNPRVSIDHFPVEVRGEDVYVDLSGSKKDDDEKPPGSVDA